jgi:8-oxo-dGTP pyrophosphatase MutT (NUDIX family)
MFRTKERTSTTQIASLEYLALYALEYLDGDIVRPWDCAQRVHGRTAATTASAITSQLPVDAVDLIVVLEGSPSSIKEINADPAAAATIDHASDDNIVIVVQYRPPLDAFCVEFPAGLVDPGETPVEAALRELREETGYVATPDRCEDVSDVLAYEPGLTNSCFRLVTVHVDLCDPLNQHPVQQLDGGEDIVVYTVPHNHCMGAALKSICTATEALAGKQCVVDGKVQTYAAGLAAAQRIASRQRRQAAPVDSPPASLVK